MWYCDNCDIEIRKNNKNIHIKSKKHQLKIGNNPYENSKIYKIICNETNRQYIGSTINTLQHRLKDHILSKKSKEKNNSKQYNCASHQILDNCRIELIEEYKCKNLDELRIREQYHIENNDCINSIRAKGIGKARYDENYRKNNRDKIMKNKREYYKNNRDKVNKYKREYYKKNRDKCLARLSKKVECECGAIHRHDGTAKHKRSQRHVAFINSIS